MNSTTKSPDGLHIAYEVLGTGSPVLLIHGFASSRAQNWKATGWYRALEDAGYRVIAMDCRGHGESDKPHDPAFYSYRLMAADALAVLEAVHAEHAHILGYSMGGHLGIEILMNCPQVLRSLVIGGVGETYLQSAFRSRFVLADALLARDPSQISDPVQKSFRLFAGQPGKDRLALAACMRGDRHSYSTAELARATRPALVVCGALDAISGPPGPLASALRGGRAVTVPGRDHMSAVGDKRTKSAALEFLAQ